MTVDDQVIKNRMSESRGQSSRAIAVMARRAETPLRSRGLDLYLARSALAVMLLPTNLAAENKA
uniref:Uncharacterized protein n=1 Tax=Oryza glumipatula TaxID=40148 RepID=A0A0E0AYE6_9ORYZ